MNKSRIRRQIDTLTVNDCHIADTIVSALTGVGYDVDVSIIKNDNGLITAQGIEVYRTEEKENSNCREECRA